MKKVICDVCGTTYPDTAGQCPICGYSNQGDANYAAETQETELHHTRTKGGRFSEANVRRRNQQPDSGDHNAEPEEFYEEEESRAESNPVLVSLLVIVIAALLVTTAFIFFRYFLPNNLPEVTQPTEESVQESTGESTLPTVPCTSLVITDGVLRVELKAAGDKHLLNVMALPGDTTDELVYTSGDESVATVNGEGRVTAVGEGETQITITCGNQSMTCTVICEFPDAQTQEPTDQT